MLSDTIFDGITMIVRDCARMKVNDYGYDDKLYAMILNDLATLSARGIELDIGGDGWLDPDVFVDAAARESFINDARVRLEHQFEEFQTEFKKQNVDGLI